MAQQRPSRPRPAPDWLSPGDAAPPGDERRFIHLLSELRLPWLRALRTRIYRATIRGRRPSAADLVDATAFCLAMRTVPRYSRGVAFEKLRLQLETILPVALALDPAEVAAPAIEPDPVTQAIDSRGAGLHDDEEVG